MGKPAVAIELSVAERRELQSLARAQKTCQAMARQARIVLAAATGLENKAICVDVGADANTVGKWRRRFAAERLDGLLAKHRVRFTVVKGHSGHPENERCDELAVAAARQFG